MRTSRVLSQGYSVRSRVVPLLSSSWLRKGDTRHVGPVGGALTTDGQQQVLVRTGQVETSPVHRGGIRGGRVGKQVGVLPE